MSQRENGTTQSQKEIDLVSRLSILESKTEEIQHLSSQRNRISPEKSHIERLIEYMPTYYVTFISIIQSAALGLLLLAILDQLTTVSKGTFEPLWTVLTIGLFFFIVAIWMTYTRSVAVFVLVPQTLDAIIPFCFAVTQALAVFSINLHEVAWFYYSLCSIAVVGYVQYYHTFHQARLHLDKNRAVLQLLGNWDQKARLMAVVRGLTFLSFGVAESILHLESLYLALITLIYNVLLIVFLHRGFKVLSEF